MRALLIGGNGPTGPLIAGGLRDRGFTVTILHRGRHESPELPSELEHVHADPFDAEQLRHATAARHFDLVVATYGSLGRITEVFAGRTDRMVAVGGTPVYRGWLAPESNDPPGLPVPVREDHPLAAAPEHGEHSYRVARAEQRFFGAIGAGAFDGTLLRYPHLYGPRLVQPRIWSIIRRLQDGRRVFALPQGGRTVSSRGYTTNMAHALLLAVDRPSEASGRPFNVADRHQYSDDQWVRAVAAAMGFDVEILTLPDMPGNPWGGMLGHRSAYNRIVDVGDAHSVLGYEDVIEPLAAVAETVRWYQANPLEPGSPEESVLRDPFDYALEDRIIAVIREAQDRIEAMVGRPDVIRYEYESNPRPLT